MANDAVRTAHIKDTTDLYADIASGDLPAVSFVKPSGWADGHPASSKWNLYEGFVKKIVDAVQSNKKLWESTAIRMAYVLNTTDLNNAMDCLDIALKQYPGRTMA